MHSIRWTGQHGANHTTVGHAEWHMPPEAPRPKLFVHDWRMMMKRLFVLLPVLLLAPTGLIAGPGDQNQGDSRMDALLERFDEHTPGVVIGVVENGELVYSRAAGAASLRFGVPFTPETATNIGSTAKQFTGLAVAMLHEQGKLSLDDDIRDYFPDLPDFGEAVTLRHLATHTSGYREFINALALAGRNIQKSDWVEPEEVLGLVRRQPELQNIPGAEWNYNNTGYGLLARVIEQVTGQAFAEWMEAEIFMPLGMSSTRVRRAPDRIILGASTGHAKDGDHWVEARDVGGAAGAGGVYTTVDDMGRWMAELGRFQLGGAAAKTLMTTPYVLSNGEATNYGLGLMIDEWRGVQRWHHGGGDIGHLSAFHYFPGLDAGFMIFANHHEIDSEFIHAVADAFFGQHLEPRDASTSGPVDAELLVADGGFSDDLFDRYAGRYELEVMPGFILRFFRDEDRYMTQATGQPAFEITPVAANSFTIDVVQARIEFHVEEDGSVESLTLFQNGEHRAARVEVASEATPDLQAYVGRYFSEELETVYEILIEDGSLHLSHRRFGPLNLHHAGADRFSGGFPVSHVEFQRNEQGDVTGLKAGNVRARDVEFGRLD